MVNDWVKTDDGISKVVSIPDAFHIDVEDNDYTYDEYLVYPIPLTEEILKANRFDIVQDGNMLTIWKQKDNEYGGEVYDITIYAMVNDFRCDCSIRFHGAIRKTIYYVHELQHALRLCGLDELADNFKIE